MSERVYYMDRKHNTLVTDNQVVIEGKNFALDRLRDARVEGKHIGEARYMETALKIVGALGVVGAFLAVVLIGHTPAGDTLFGLSFAVAAVCLVNLILFSLSRKQGHALVLYFSNGFTEEVKWEGDKRNTYELAQAVQEALSSSAKNRRSS